MNSSAAFLKLYHFIAEYVEHSDNPQRAIQDVSHIATVLQHEHEALYESNSSRSTETWNRYSELSKTGWQSPEDARNLST